MPPISDAALSKPISPVDSPGGQQAPFYIPATGPASRPRRTLKHDDTFIVVDSHGDIGASAGGPDGLFHADTRHLARLELLINDAQPLLLGSNVRDDNAVLTVDLTNPDIYFDRKLLLPKDTVHVVRTLFLWRGAAYTRFGLRNYGERRISIRLTLKFDGDFADLFEVRGLSREVRGTIAPAVVGTERVVLHYDGLDGVARYTTLIFDPAPTTLDTNSASYVVEVMPGEVKNVFLTVCCGHDSNPSPVSFLRGVRQAWRELKAASSGVATIETSNVIFNEIL